MTQTETVDTKSPERVALTDDPDEFTEQPAANDALPASSVRGRRIFAFVALSMLLAVLATATGYLAWTGIAARGAQRAAGSAVAAASDISTAMLSYQPDTVETDLRRVQEKLTGPFKDSYQSLVNDVVIPGAKQKMISSTAKVVAAGPVSASDDRAVVLLFVDQTTKMGGDPPTASASSVRVTLEHVNDRWLVSAFDPV